MWLRCLNDGLSFHPTSPTAPGAERKAHHVRDPVTNLVRKACAESIFGAAMIDRLIKALRARLEKSHDLPINVPLFYGAEAGSTGWLNFRVEVPGKNVKRIADLLEYDYSGEWNEEALKYEGRLSNGSLFEVSADAENQVVVVVFW
ncbi:hypothetical protein ACVWZK_001745 [Bradyrhizobium sp. GM0.4]